MFLGREEKAAGAVINVDELCDVILANIGVLQQDAVTGTSNPYTLPKEGYVICNISASQYFGVSQGEGLGGTVALTLYVDNKVVYTKTQNFYGTSSGSLSHTYTGFCKAGTVFKLAVGSGDKGAMTVKLNPYSLYKIEKDDVEVTENE